MSAVDLTIKEIVKTPPTDLLAWSVMHLISLHKGDFLEHYGIDASNHDNTVKVELRINGVEVSPREVFAELERQHDSMVKRAAQELISAKCGNVTAALDRIRGLAEYAEEQAATALGVDSKDPYAHR